MVNRHVKKIASAEWYQHSWDLGQDFWTLACGHSHTNWAYKQIFIKPSEVTSPLFYLVQSHGQNILFQWITSQNKWPSERELYKFFKTFFPFQTNLKEHGIQFSFSSSLSAIMFLLIMWEEWVWICVERKHSVQCKKQICLWEIMGTVHSSNIKLFF